MISQTLLIRKRGTYEIFVQRESLRSHHSKIPLIDPRRLNECPAESLARVQLCLASAQMKVRPYHSAVLEVLSALTGKRPTAKPNETYSLLELLESSNFSPRECMLPLIIYLHYQHFRLLLPDPNLETLDGLCAAAAAVDQVCRGINSMEAAIYMCNAARVSRKYNTANFLTYSGTAPQNYCEPRLFSDQSPPHKEEAPAEETPLASPTHDLLSETPPEEPPQYEAPAEDSEQEKFPIAIFSSPKKFRQGSWSWDPYAIKVLTPA